MTSVETQSSPPVDGSVQDLNDTVEKLRRQNSRLSEEANRLVKDNRALRRERQALKEDSKALREENCALRLDKSSLEVDLTKRGKEKDKVQENLSRCVNFLASLRHSIYFRPGGKREDWVILKELQALEQSLHQNKAKTEDRSQSLRIFEPDWSTSHYEAALVGNAERPGQEGECDDDDW